MTSNGKKCLINTMTSRNALTIDFQWVKRKGDTMLIYWTVSQTFGKMYGICNREKMLQWLCKHFA